MPIPYRPLPRSAASSQAGYLQIVATESAFYGGLLIADALGQPIEFVHTSAETPSGVLWPEAEARAVAHSRIAHSLFMPANVRRPCSSHPRRAPERLKPTVEASSGDRMLQVHEHSAPVVDSLRALLTAILSWA